MRKAETLSDVINEPLKCHNCMGKGQVVAFSIHGSNETILMTCPICKGKKYLETKNEGDDS